MFEKVIVFGLFEMIKKKSEDRILGFWFRFGFGLWVGLGTTVRAVTVSLL